MAEQKIDIYFKINGLEAYIDDLETLDSVLKQVQKATKDASKETDDLASSQKEASEEGGFLKERLDGFKDTFGKLKADFKLATRGIKTFFTTGTSGAKALKIAFASTGIGLLVVAIASLVDYFKNTEEGSRVLQVAFESVGVIVNKFIGFLTEIPSKLKAVFEDPVQSIQDFATTIQDFVLGKIEQLLEGFSLVGTAIKRVFEGDFDGAAEAAKEGFLKIGDSALALNPVTAGAYQLGQTIVNDVVPAVKEAVEQTNDYVKAQRALRDLQQDLIVQNAQLTKELETNQKVAEDTTLTYDERKEALDRVNEANIQLAKNAAQEAKANEQAIKSQLEITTNYEEREELETRLAEATAERINRETELSIKEQEAAKLSRELEQEELDRQNTINNTIEQLRAENIQNEEEAAVRALEIAKEQALQELNNLKATDEEKAALAAEFDTQINNTRQQFADERVAREQEVLNKLEQQNLTAREKEINDITSFYDELLLQVEGNAELEKQINDEKNKALKEANERFRKEDVDKDKQAQMAKLQNGLNLASQGIAALQALNDAAAGESEAERKRAFNRNKALGISSALINTASAVIGAISPAAGGLGIPAGLPGAAIATATGLAQILKIKNTKFDGGSNDVGGVQTPQVNVPSFNPQNALNNTNQNLAGLQNAGEDVIVGETPPIKAYVVSTEMTSQQEADFEIENLSRL